MVNRGFTLLELAIVLAASALVTGAVVPSFVRSAYIDAARRTSLDIAQIQEAARSYYVKNKAWPTAMTDLKTAGYIDIDWMATNPFGKPYLLEPSGQVLLVQTEVRPEVTGVLTGLLPMSTVNGAKVASAVTIPGVDAQALPVGAVIPWPGEEIPIGWMICDGMAVLRADHSELFAILGIIYGAGDGVTTFNLPDLRGRVVVGMDNMGGSVANVIAGPWARQIGGIYGEENHALTIPEMPSHTHGYSETPWTGSRYDGHSSPLMTGQVASITSATGGNQAHNNIQPSIAMNWIIKG